MPMPVSPTLTKAPFIPKVQVGQGQTDYLVLPSIVSNSDYGIVTTRWKFTWYERMHILIFGSIWLQQMTFRSRCYAPIKLLVVEPPIEDCL
jgi:hypothetical protein